MFPFHWEYPPDKCPSPSKDLPGAFVKEVADKYQEIGFPIMSQLFPSSWDEHVYSHLCPYLGNWVMVLPLQPSIKVMAGGGIRRYTLSPSSTREPSPVRVINAATLNQVRLYTFVAAEVKYDDLLFTPYQDPFANVALKHEEANEEIFR
ncbi:hypothetical protein LIER_10873 [Lithospermum erythrorhizon]|uniref:Uncharacterized protein n=1 Tax=Lithospermum erythrorhizon TaxID=34254 RepID=A0AAV3PN85_LITER